MNKQQEFNHLVEALFRAMNKAQRIPDISDLDSRSSDYGQRLKEGTDARNQSLSAAASLASFVVNNRSRIRFEDEP